MGGEANEVTEISAPGWRIGFATVVAVIPLLGYATSYSYAWGQAHFYGYPRDLIRVDLSTALAFGFPAALGVVVFAFALRFVAAGGRRSGRHTWFWRALPLAIVMPLTLLVAALMDPGTSTETKLVGLLVSIATAGALLTLSYVAANATGPQAAKTNAALDDSFLQFGSRAAIAAIVLLGGLFWGGSLDARDRESYLTTGGVQSYVVVTTYGDRVIEAAYSPRERCFTRTYRVFQLGANSLEATLLLTPAV